MDILTCYFSVCIHYLCLLKGRERFAFVRLKETSRIAVQSVWLDSYVVSRVTVFLTAQYFKARFVWKCLHSTCTAVGLAVVAFIRLSVSSFGALICGSTCSQLLISAQQLQIKQLVLHQMSYLPFFWQIWHWHWLLFKNVYMTDSIYIALDLLPLRTKEKKRFCQHPIVWSSSIGDAKIGFIS